MQIEVKGRNLPVTDELRECVTRRFEKVGKQVSELAVLEVELSEERNPANPDSQVAEATLHLKGVTLRVARGVPRPQALDQPDLGRAGPPGQAPPRQAAQAARGPRGGRDAGRRRRRGGPGRGRAGLVAEGALGGVRPGSAGLYPLSHVDPRPRPPPGRRQAVQAVRQARRAHQPVGAGARAPRRRRAARSTPTRCASARATASRSTTSSPRRSPSSARRRGAPWACATSTSS